MIVPMTWIAAVLTFAWPYAKTKGALVAIAVLYGCVPPPVFLLSITLWTNKPLSFFLSCSGSWSNAAFVSSFNMPLYEMGQMGDVGRRIGTVMMFSALGALVGPPISGAILRASGGLEGVSYYAGMCSIIRDPFRVLRVRSAHFASRSGSCSFLLGFLFVFNALRSFHSLEMNVSGSVSIPSILLSFNASMHQIRDGHGYLE